MAKSTELTISARRGGFVVVRDGVELTGVITRDNEAKDTLEKMIKAKSYTVRPCITCRKEFTSEGAHNRMCVSCRNLSEGMI